MGDSIQPCLTQQGQNLLFKNEKRKQSLHYIYNDETMEAKLVSIFISKF